MCAPTTCSTTGGTGLGDVRPAITGDRTTPTLDATKTRVPDSLFFTFLTSKKIFVRNAG